MIAENSRTLIATKMMPCSFRDFTHVTAPINSLKKAINITLSQHVLVVQEVLSIFMW